MTVQNQTALITGGANGIGHCCARELLRNGAKVVAILDLDDSNGENSVAELENEFGKGSAIFFVCDVADDQKFKETFQKVVDTFVTLDIVINCAGIMNDANWEPMVDINYKGVVRGTVLALNHMGLYKGGKGGTIVNMSSVAGLYPNAIAPIYAGTSYAILGFTTSLKVFYEKTGTRVLTICPGLTSTSMASKFMASKALAMDVLDDEIAAREMTVHQQQSPEHVANAMIELLEKGENGAVFVSENNEPPYAIEIPHYTTIKAASSQ